MAHIKHIVIDARIRRSSTGRYTDRLIEHLQDFDQENRYTILLEPGDPWRPRNNNFTVGICRFRQFSLNPIDQIAFPWQLYRLKSDLVHFTMTQQPIFYFGKTITTTHDLTMLNFARAGKLAGWVHAIRMLAYRFLIWWAHLKSRRIIVPTNFVAQDIANHYTFAKKKTRVTYEASDHLEKIKATPLKEAHKPFIFHVGSPFPHKNIEGLIQAFAVVRENHPDLQLILGGKKEYYYKKLEKWAKDSSITNSILFYGFIPDSGMRWLHENAEAYVLPSLSEGFAIPGLEAMANGCPLISSNATCLPEVFGDAAHYFDPSNADDIARAIKEVLQDSSLRQRLIMSGKEQVKKYSWDKMAKETLEVYKETLQN